jgi:hypothetical protein
MSKWGLRLTAAVSARLRAAQAPFLCILADR